MNPDNLLARWDAFFEKGHFPYTRFGYQEKFSPHKLRLTAYATPDRWMLVFEQVGFSYISLEDPLHNWVVVLTGDTGKEPAWHYRAKAGTPQLTREQGYDYSFDDETARVAEERDGGDPQDPNGDWARLKQFKLTIDNSAPFIVRPNHADYRRAGCEVTPEQYGKNYTLRVGDLYQVAASKLATRFFSADPMKEFDLAGGPERDKWKRLFRDEGQQIVAHVLDETPPSQTAYYQGLAAALTRSRAQTVATADPVEAAVRKELGLADGQLTESQLARIRTLQLGDKPKLIHLDFCSRLKNLEVLQIFRTNVRDLTPLASCRNLRELNAAYSRIRDLSPLAKLKRLQKLDLSQTEVRDLNPLAGLVGLRELELEGTKVSNLKPLARLTHLDELFLQSTAVKDIEPLVALKRLGRLGLDRTGVKDLSPVSAMHALQVLWCRDTKVKDVAPLAGLRSLYFLALGSSPVEDFRSLLGSPRLSELSFRGPKTRPGLHELKKRGVKLVT